MEPTLARVLNTLAHEIRTPLAVSQGYLKLLLEGRLASAEEQRSAFERTRQALGVISKLCADMGGISVASEASNAALDQQLPSGELMGALNTALAPQAPLWRGEATPDGAVAATGAADLVKALTTVASVAFTDAGASARVVHVSAGPAGGLTLRVGSEDAVAALPESASDPLAGEVDLERGGLGLALLWAAFVLQRHHVTIWQRADGRGAIAMYIPLVNA